MTLYSQTGQIHIFQISHVQIQISSEFELGVCASPWMCLLYLPRTDLTPLDEGLNEDL